MRVYLVTTKSREESTEGELLAVYMRTFGIYTSFEAAMGIAVKVDGTVKEMILDQELSGTILQELHSWQ